MLSFLRLNRRTLSKRNSSSRLPHLRLALITDNRDMSFFLFLSLSLGAPIKLSFYYDDYVSTLSKQAYMNVPRVFYPYKLA